MTITGTGLFWFLYVCVGDTAACKPISMFEHPMQCVQAQRTFYRQPHPVFKYRCVLLKEV